MPRDLLPRLPQETLLAIRRAGGRRPLAEQLGLGSTAIREWENAGRVPVQHVRRVSQITGLQPHDIRPDVYPPTTHRLPEAIEIGD
jgi:DNA-binding transcriptional regulator YdaS (Cro superfamily)